jgi:transmembrane sensor
VSQDAGRPFVVHAGRTMVRALGTAFGVRMYNTLRAAVLVTDGRVMVTTPTRGFFGAAGSTDMESIVSAGERAFDNAGRVSIFTLDSEDMEARHAWRHGMFIFRDQPLSEVVSEFNRYNRRQIRIMDPSIADLRFNGRLGLNGVDRFLAVLADAHGIEAQSNVGGEDIVELRRRGRP